MQFVAQKTAKSGQTVKKSFYKVGNKSTKKRLLRSENSGSSQIFALLIKRSDTCERQIILKGLALESGIKHIYIAPLLSAFFIWLICLFF
ncbi:MAG TPA: hypothetical protein PKZ16_00655 [bacterium]|nr:hypothetical protein [bacterium]